MPYHLRSAAGSPVKGSGAGKAKAPLLSQAKPSQAPSRAPSRDRKGKASAQPNAFVPSDIPGLRGVGNFQTHHMLGTMTPPFPQKNKYGGYRENNPSSNHDDSKVHEQDEKFPEDIDDSNATMFEASPPTRDARVVEHPHSSNVSLDLSQLDIHDNTDLTITDVSSLTWDRSYDGRVNEDLLAEDGEIVYPDREPENPSTNKDTTVRAYVANDDKDLCSFHCTAGEAALLYAVAPTRSSLIYRDSILDDLERLYYIHRIKATNRGRRMLSLGELAEDLVKFREKNISDDIEFRGLDSSFVQARLAWAKWVAKAADERLFHGPDKRCGSIRDQVKGP